MYLSRWLRFLSRKRRITFENRPVGTITEVATDDEGVEVTGYITDETMLDLLRINSIHDSRVAPPIFGLSPFSNVRYCVDWFNLIPHDEHNIVEYERYRDPSTGKRYYCPGFATKDVIDNVKIKEELWKK